MSIPLPPERDDFQGEGEYQEASAYYSARVGRIKMLVKSAQRLSDYPLPLPSMEKTLSSTDSNPPKTPPATT